MDNGKRNIGVYCIPCLDCNQSYIGESGRGLEVRLGEHKRACRLGNSYSAVATHTLQKDHRIGFNNASIIHKCSNRNQRRIVEGALIALNNTFENNKSSTSEDKYINTQICINANIKNFNNIAATLISAASPLSSQVSMSSVNAGTPGTGAYAVGTHAPEPPDAMDTPPPTRILRPRRNGRVNYGHMI